MCDLGESVTNLQNFDIVGDCRVHSTSVCIFVYIRRVNKQPEHLRVYQQRFNKAPENHTGLVSGIHQEKAAVQLNLKDRLMFWQICPFAL